MTDSPVRWRVRQILLILTCLLILVSGIAFSADYYKLNSVKRVDQDLYKTSDGTYIETQYCYHYTYGEDALLKWEGAYGDNKVIWEDDSTCKAKSVW